MVKMIRAEPLGACLTVFYPLEQKFPTGCNALGPTVQQGLLCENHKSDLQAWEKRRRDCLAPRAAAQCTQLPGFG